MVNECPACHARYHIGERPPGTRAKCRCGTMFTLVAKPTTAGTMSCPSCGAAADPERRKCGYCSATLALIACPSCFGMLFEGSRHCTHCGKKVAREAAPLENAEKARRCPRCTKSSLLGALVGDVLLDRCERCGGTFVDKTCLDELIEDRDRQAQVHAVLTHGSSGGAKTTTSEVKYLPCPECATLMTRKNFGRVSGVIIDVCGVHGTWFDADELRRVVEFVKAGGLDRSRRAEIDDLNRTIEKKRAEANKVSYTSTWEAQAAGDAVGAEVLGLFIEGVVTWIFD